MKNINRISQLFMLLLTLSISVAGQTNSSSGSVTVSYTWSSIPTHGSNQIAIWVEDTTGNFITTIFATRFTAAGGYEKRPVSLSVWAEKSGLSTAPREEVDAITGSTPSSGKQTVVWNCTDKEGKSVGAGIYIIRMEANIKNDHKMFYTGSIRIGETEQHGTGNISFEGSSETGEVLFKDVQIAYKP